MRKPRLNWLDAWIGICVCLVIFGHAMLPGVPKWYNAIHSWIYSFHMAAFFFASGALVQYHYPKQSDNGNAYLDLIKKKLLRLGLPYLLLGATLTVAKGFFDNYPFVQILEVLGYLVYKPVSSAAIFLWYIYVLLFFYIVSPFICWKKLPRKITILIAAIIIHLSPINTDFFALHLIKKYLFFFCLGTMVWETRHITRKVPDSFFVFLGILFFLSSFHIINLPFIINALLAISTLNFLSRHIVNIKAFGKINKLFSLISRNSFDIYLFQMPCIVMLYYCLKLLLGAPSNPFWWIFFLLLIPVSIIGPLAIAAIIACAFTFFKKRINAWIEEYSRIRANS